MIKPLKPLSLRNFSGKCIVWGYSACRAGSSVRKCFLFQQYSSEKNGSCDLGAAQGAQGALPLVFARRRAQPKSTPTPPPAPRRETPPPFSQRRIRPHTSVYISAVWRSSQSLCVLRTPSLGKIIASERLAHITDFFKPVILY